MKNDPTALEDELRPAQTAGNDLSFSAGVSDALRAQLAAAGFGEAVEVGHGGFGVVYRCTQTELGRTVAVKVLTTTDADGAARFTREQHLLAALTGHTDLPQVLIRVGNVPALDKAPPPTPRRPLADVLRLNRE